MQYSVDRLRIFTTLELNQVQQKYNQLRHIRLSLRCARKLLSFLINFDKNIFNKYHLGFK